MTPGKKTEKSDVQNGASSEVVRGEKLQEVQKKITQIESELEKARDKQADAALKQLAGGDKMNLEDLQSANPGADKVGELEEKLQALKNYLDRQDNELENDEEPGHKGVPFSDSEPASGNRYEALMRRTRDFEKLYREFVALSNEKQESDGQWNRVQQQQLSDLTAQVESQGQALKNSYQDERIGRVFDGWFGDLKSGKLPEGQMPRVDERGQKRKKRNQRSKGGKTQEPNTSYQSIAEGDPSSSENGQADLAVQTREFETLYRRFAELKADGEKNGAIWDSVKKNEYDQLTGEVERKGRILESRYGDHRRAFHNWLGALERGNLKEGDLPRMLGEKKKRTTDRQESGADRGRSSIERKAEKEVRAQGRTEVLEKSNTHELEERYRKLFLEKKAIDAGGDDAGKVEYIRRVEEELGIVGPILEDRLEKLGSGWRKYRAWLESLPTETLKEGGGPVFPGLKIDEKKYDRPPVSFAAEDGDLIEERLSPGEDVIDPNEVYNDGGMRTQTSHGIDRATTHARTIQDTKTLRKEIAAFKRKEKIRKKRTSKEQSSDDLTVDEPMSESEIRPDHLRERIKIIDKTLSGMEAELAELEKERDVKDTAKKNVADILALGKKLPTDSLDKELTQLQEDTKTLKADIEEQQKLRAMASQRLYGLTNGVEGVEASSLVTEEGESTEKEEAIEESMQHTEKSTEADTERESRVNEALGVINDLLEKKYGLQMTEEIANMPMSEYVQQLEANVGSLGSLSESYKSIAKLAIDVSSRITAGRDTNDPGREEEILVLRKDETIGDYLRRVAEMMVDAGVDTSSLGSEYIKDEEIRVFIGA